MSSDILWTIIPSNTYFKGFISSKIPLLFFWKILQVTKPFWRLAGGWVSFQDESWSVSINNSSGRELQGLRNKLRQRLNPRKAERFSGLLNLKTFLKVKWEIIYIHLIVLSLQKGQTLVQWPRRWERQDWWGGKYKAFSVSVCLLELPTSHSYCKPYKLFAKRASLLSPSPLFLSEEYLAVLSYCNSKG